MWGPAGARGSIEGQRPRGPPVRVRGCVPPRCAGARPPPLCACADLREVRARGTRLPGCTARTCWRLSLLRRTPCHTLRRVGRCAGGGGRRPRVEMAEPEVVPPLSEGVPDLQQAGADAAPVVLAKRLPLDLLPRVAGRIPWSWKAAMRSSHDGRGCPWWGLAMYTWRPVRWGVSASHWHPFAVSLWRRASRVPSATASHPLAALRSRPAPGAARLRYRWGT